MLLAIKFSGAENCDNFGRGHSGKLMSAIRPAVDAIERLSFLSAHGLYFVIRTA